MKTVWTKRGYSVLWWAVGMLAACRSSEAAFPEGSSEQPGTIAPPKLDNLARSEFNQRAAERFQPIFWRNDAATPGELSPDELAVTWTHEMRPRTDFVDAQTGRFTPAFEAIYEQLKRPSEPAQLAPEENARRKAIRLELAQGRPTLIESDFSTAAEADRALSRRLLRVAVLIERLYARQKGTLGLDQQIPPDDAASAAVFFRNQGPLCKAPKTESDPACSALPQRSRPVFGLYPAAIQSDPAFCRTLEKQPNARELMDHFSVVVSGAAPNTFAAVKYSEAFREEMQAIAGELEAAAAGVVPEEAALAEYLRRAAQAFRDDDWEPANEAWVAMSAESSKYYLRVGPDEVYYEPCAWKAGFAMTFARIDQASLEWQKRLAPIKQDLENEVARLAGKPYRARTVSFKLPDFIDVVLNAGDSRHPLGGVAGQSLPNWGAVAAKGGRTMLMANLYTDDDSKQALSEQMSSLFCPTTMAQASADPEPAVMGVVLHEAAHNLGPAHEYQVNGKVDRVVFGGPLASMLEELKSQTAALYFPSRLVERQLITRDEAQRAEVRDIAWGFGHIAQGMYDAQGGPKAYSQLASIQLGYLESEGALEWRADVPAANGSDRGCFDLHFERWDEAAKKLAQLVFGIKARGDRDAAERLKRQWVDADGVWKERRGLITERWLRAPKASFVYSIAGL
jgi:hypothetical protein